jgi:RHS repeat-associated protein
LWGNAVDQLLSDEQYASGTGPDVNATVANTTAGNTLWALTDHLGSVRDLVDNNGIIREHNVYDSFGRLIREVDYDAVGAVIASTSAAAVDTLFGYTARDFDADVGLQNNRARWYDPATGRWLSQDPIGFAAGDANLYRYVGNGPTGATDPTGLYNEAGHFFTVYLVALAAGKRPSEAFRLAYYSQLPDQVGMMEAVTAAKRDNNLFGKLVFDCIHSLHGGNAEASEIRRTQLRDFLRNNYRSINAWQKGILLHALGDAYAHTDGNNEAWAWRRGHFWAGHQPDWISSDPNKYRDYVRSLYASLGGQGDIENNAELMSLLEFAATLPQDEEGERMTMLLWAREHGYNPTSIGFPDYVPNWEFNQLDELPTPTRQEVERFMNYMCDNVITPGEHTRKARDSVNR